MSLYRLLMAGEQGLVVEFAKTIDCEINARVHKLHRALSQASIVGILEAVPSYSSLMIYFDPFIITRRELGTRIAALIDAVDSPSCSNDKVRVISVPTCYTAEYGPDLDDVAKHNNLTVDEVVSIHTSKPYLVYMLGFTPGFPYLGIISPKIAMSRLFTPRISVPAGSVAIAENQTGIYPMQSPGGWRIIGRTPLQIFKPEALEAFLFNPGDYVQFENISLEQYFAIQSEVNKGTYIPKIRLMSLEVVKNA